MDWVMRILETERGNTSARETYRRATLLSCVKALDRDNPRLRPPVGEEPEMGDPEPGHSLDEDAQRMADLTLIGDEERRATVLRRAALILHDRARENGYEGRESRAKGKKESQAENGGHIP